MSYQVHMKGYDDLRTLYQIDSLYALKHDTYFPPVMVEISTTHMCNQRCRYCYTHERGGDNDKLSDDVLINCFSQIADAGVKAVLVQGSGEPLLHRGLPAAIEAGAKCNLSIGLTTNGVLLNKSLQEKILKYLFYIRFSVLDSDPERYAYLHGCSQKQWEHLIRNIKDAVKMRDMHNLKLAFWATVYLYEDNFRDAYNIIKFFKDIGIDYIVVQEATYTEFSPAGKKEEISKSFSDAEINEMKNKILTLGDNDFCVKVRFPINDNTYFVGMNKECWQSNYCQGIKFYTIIASDGEVYPCWRVWGKNEYSYGSLYKNSFEEIWKGKGRMEIDKLVNNTPPIGDECAVCNISKLNDILHKFEDTTSTKWRDFLI